jgi:hypothetical protein
MKAYFVKCEIDIKKKVQKFVKVLNVFAYDEDEARQKAEQQIEKEFKCRRFQILRVSTLPIRVHSYHVEANLKYKNGSSRTFHFNANAENEDEAENIFRGIVGRWHLVVGMEIVSIEKKTHYEKY